MEKNMYSREEAVAASLVYFDGDNLAANVFVDKYALKDNDGNILEDTPDKMHDRLAKEFARIEQKYPNPLSEAEILHSIKNFKYIVPQGSPMEGIGNNHRVTSLSNCYVIPSPEDSYGGIFKADQQEAQLMKRRGGVGMDISNIRPKGMSTNNAAKTTDGIAVFMDRFSNTCREVAQNGRRGALMLTIDCRHPEVETFINIKRDKTRVTGANISVKMSDDFMEAVKNDTTYQQKWPINSPNPSIVRDVNAREIWEQIIDAAWTSAEPGILFWDNAIKNTPSDIYTEEGFGSVSTNPCGEIILSPSDSCRLISLNLLSFVMNPFTEKAQFDYIGFKSYVKMAQRLMDDMIDLELEKLDAILNKIDADNEPESVKREEKELWISIREACLNGRRTGLGITALGDTIAALGIIYGSAESIETTESIYKTLALGAHESSIDMAEERGSFPVFNYDKEKSHEYLSRVICELGPEYVLKWRKFGRRNIALTTTAPTGTVSLMTQTTSGIEPCFQPVYKRRKKILSGSTDRVDHIDVNGDKWTEFEVCHHQFSEWRKISGKTNVEDSPYYKATANDVDWSASVELQAVAQKWIDHSISKTCNLPNSATKELVSEIYMKAWEVGCKGFTIYRDGCRDGVLLTGSEEKKSTFETKDAPKRPDILSCGINQVKIKNDSWTVLVGLMEDKPYEIFAGLSKFVSIPKSLTKGQLIKTKIKGSKKSSYDLRLGESDDSVVIKDIGKVFENPTEGEFTRMISLTLRHGAPIQYVVEQLQKDEESDMYSFSKVIARVLKKYIPEGAVTSETCPSCGSKIVYIEGCKQCQNCAWSKC
jgi:ribonucleoside-diphosphate reductase alpha chain